MMISLRPKLEWASPFIHQKITHTNRVKLYPLKYTEAQLIALIRRCFPQKALPVMQSNTSVCKELMFDSLDCLRLGLEIEDAFHVEFSPERAVDTLAEVAEEICRSKPQGIDLQ